LTIHELMTIHDLMKGYSKLDIYRGRRGRDHVVVLQLPMQSVPIPTNIVSSNPAQAKYTRYNTTLCDEVCQ